MSNTTDKMLDRYVYLHIGNREPTAGGVTIQVKLDDEGVVVDAWHEYDGVDECVATAWKTYNEMGIEVKEIKGE